MLFLVITQYTLGHALRVLYELKFSNECTQNVCVFYLFDYLGFVLIKEIPTHNNLLSWCLLVNLGCLMKPYSLSTWYSIAWCLTCQVIYKGFYRSSDSLNAFWLVPSLASELKCLFHALYKCSANCSAEKKKVFKFSNLILGLNICLVCW